MQVTEMASLLSAALSLQSAIVDFLDHLKSCGSSHKNLRWVVSQSDNSIDDEGVSALIESLPELFPSLEDVYLYGNPVSGEVKEKLRKILDVSFSVNVLLT